MTLDTERLRLRPWTEEDAQDCYEYARDPSVGPIAGWPPHVSVENSRTIIRDILVRPENYAIVWKESGQVIGAIGLMFGSETTLTDRSDECELGYWLGASFWGRGIMTEAAKEVLRHAFEDLGVRKVWCGYFDGNARSVRVQEKLGFTFCKTERSMYVAQMKEYRMCHITCLSEDAWKYQASVERV